MTESHVTTSKYQLKHLDDVDLELLCILNDEQLWKSKAHTRMQTDRSIQTIGRRITCLQDAGLIKTCILSPDEINRDLIIGYTTTDAGAAILDEEICETCHAPRSAIDHEHRFDSVKNCFSH